MRHKILSSSRTSGVGGRVVEEFRSCLSKPEGSVLTCFITFSLATIQVSIIHVTVTKVSLAQSVSELHCN